jgi:hypothetical protein
MYIFFTIKFIKYNVFFNTKISLMIVYPYLIYNLNMIFYRPKVFVYI